MSPAYYFIFMSIPIMMVIADQFEEIQTTSANFKDRIIVAFSQGFQGHESGPQIAIVIAGLSVLLAAILVVIFVHLILQEKKANLLPPGPRPWPILGNFPSLAWADQLPHRSLRVLAAKFGGLMYLRLGSQPCIVVSTAAVAKELFQTNDATFSSRPKKVFFSILNGSDDYKTLAAAPYGPHWRGLRKFYNSELFSPKRVASYQRYRTEEVHYMMKVLVAEASKGHEVKIRAWVSGVTGNIMTRMLINKRNLGNDEHEKEEVGNVVTFFLNTLGAFIIDDYVPWLSFTTKGWRSKVEDFAIVLETVTTKVFELEQHRQQAITRQSQAKEPYNEYVPDFVDLLLTEPLEDGKPLTNKHLVVILTEMLIAGTDTSTTTVEWAMAELTVHPKAMKRAQDELEKTVGHNHIVQESDLPNLPFLQAVVKEVFRLHPPTALALPRESTHESNLLGYHLPARTQLILNLHTIHRDPSVYENPDAFDPDRFLELHPTVSHTTGSDSFELIPFGLGRRMCPAFNAGSLIVTLLLAHLLHSFDWSLPAGQSVETLDMSDAFGTTVCLKNPLCLIGQSKRSASLY